MLYDTANIYLWSRSSYPVARERSWKGYHVYRLAHGGTPTERDMGICGGTPGFVREAVVRLRTENRFFSCAPVTTFTAVQRKKGSSIYDSKESYLATMVHELGHQYMEQELWQVSVIQPMAGEVKKLQTRTSQRRILEEAYAIWCELHASQRLFPGHFNRLAKDFGRSDSQWPHDLGHAVAMKFLEWKPGR